MTTLNAAQAAGLDTPRTKVAHMLWVLLTHGSLNRFEAERHHDHCLHSTVSTLQNEYGIEIARQMESVPCVNGTKRTRCKRYWLRRDPGNLAKAWGLLRAWKAVP